MKKTLLITTIFLMTALLLTGCKSAEEKQTEKVMDKFEEVIDLQRKVVEGEISEEDATEIVEGLSEEFEEMSEMMEQDLVTGLPDWAKELGLTEPKGLELDQDLSSATSADSPNGSINSVTLVYTGDYETSMKEAEKIATTANIPLNKEFEMAKELQENLPEALRGSVDLEDIKGVVYTNYEMTTLNEVEYPISINVEEDGTLTISTYNQTQLLE